jgi:5-methylcytosine-specific restriction enzyme subunit McrC
VCAERALADQLNATGEWRTDRVRQVLPHLRAVVGSRPRLPPLHEVMRVRYTPMTLPFKQVAVLSHRIASRLGYSASDEPGQAEGILIDVAELWELFVLNCARQAVSPGLRVEHGTTKGRSDFLLRSSTGSREMGRLKPDLLVLEGDRVRAVIDAKYKRLSNTRDRPAGVDQADLYQLVAYAMRFEPEAFAALAYPAPLVRAPVSTAEGSGPWSSDDHTFIFVRLPLRASECRERLRELLSTAGQGIELAA